MWRGWPGDTRPRSVIRPNSCSIQEQRKDVVGQLHPHGPHSRAASRPHVPLDRNLELGDRARKPVSDEGRQNRYVQEKQGGQCRLDCETAEAVLQERRRDERGKQVQGKRKVSLDRESGILGRSLVPLRCSSFSLQQPLSPILTRPLKST